MSSCRLGKLTSQRPQPQCTDRDHPARLTTEHAAECNPGRAGEQRRHDDPGDEHTCRDGSTIAASCQPCENDESRRHGEKEQHHAWRVARKHEERSDRGAEEKCDGKNEEVAGTQAKSSER